MIYVFGTDRKTGTETILYKGFDSTVAGKYMHSLKVRMRFCNIKLGLCNNPDYNFVED